MRSSLAIARRARCATSFPGSAEVEHVFVVDDACPERSGDLVAVSCSSDRVTVIQHAVNQGVGGAMISGYRAALAAGFEVMVKPDADGQIAPHCIPDLVHPSSRA